MTRQEQDDFARRSHQMALDAKEKGYLTDIIPVKVGLGYKYIIDIILLFKKIKYEFNAKYILNHFYKTK